MPIASRCLFGGTLLAAGLASHATPHIAHAQEFVPELYVGFPHVAYFYAGADDGDASQFSYATTSTPADAFQSHAATTPLGWEGSASWDATIASVSAQSGGTGATSFAYSYGYFSGYFTVSEDTMLRASWDFAEETVPGTLFGIFMIDDLDAGEILVEELTLLGGARRGTHIIPLVAGVRYSAQMFVQIDSATGETMSIEAELLVDGACRADFDGDGSLTIFDFLAYQNAFDAGDLRADFDGDGSLTIFDFLAFQNEFDAGCG